jgi:hypothetical protein
MVKVDRLRALVSTFEDFQQDRIRLQNRGRAVDPYFLGLAADVRRLEEMVGREIAQELENEPLYTQYLRRIRGLGPILSGYLIAYLCRPRLARYWKKRGNPKLPPYARVVEETRDYILAQLPPVCEVATNPSKLHRYAGLAPGSRLARGEQVVWNPKVKTLMWKILMQFLKTAPGKRRRNVRVPKYAQLFQQVKREYAQRCPKPEKGSWKLKVHLTAKNITMRIFLTNLWLVYRRMHNLPVTSPYPAQLQGQHKIYTPEELLDE